MQPGGAWPRNTLITGCAIIMQRNMRCFACQTPKAHCIELDETPGLISATSALRNPCGHKKEAELHYTSAATSLLA
jgi:hypothetical protein